MIYELWWTEEWKEEMWTGARSTGDDNYQLWWMDEDLAVLVGVVAGQFVFDIPPHFIGTNKFTNL
ncbi:MAG: hypothetical protein ACLFVB_08105 [Thermoplasmata archaeon]